MKEKKVDGVKETRTVMIPGDESGKKYAVDYIQNPPKLYEHTFDGKKTRVTIPENERDDEK
jgi:hypothetical protein